MSSVTVQLVKPSTGKRLSAQLVDDPNEARPAGSVGPRAAGASSAMGQRGTEDVHIGLTEEAKEMDRKYLDAYYAGLSPTTAGDSTRKTEDDRRLRKFIEKRQKELAEDLCNGVYCKRRNVSVIEKIPVKDVKNRFESNYGEGLWICQWPTLNLHLLANIVPRAFVDLITIDDKDGFARTTHTHHFRRLLCLKAKMEFMIYVIADRVERHATLCFIALSKNPTNGENDHVYFFDRNERPHEEADNVLVNWLREEFLPLTRDDPGTYPTIHELNSYSFEGNYECLPYSMYMAYIIYKTYKTYKTYEDPNVPTDWDAMPARIEEVYFQYFFSTSPSRDHHIPVLRTALRIFLGAEMMFIKENIKDLCDDKRTEIISEELQSFSRVLRPAGRNKKYIELPLINIEYTLPRNLPVELGERGFTADMRIRLHAMHKMVQPLMPYIRAIQRSVPGPLHQERRHVPPKRAPVYGHLTQTFQLPTSSAKEPPPYRLLKQKIRW